MGVRRLDTLLVLAQQFGGGDIAAAERIALFFEGPLNHFFILRSCLPMPSPVPAQIVRAWWQSGKLPGEPVRH